MKKHVCYELDEETGEITDSVFGLVGDDSRDIVLDASKLYEQQVDMMDRAAANGFDVEAWWDSEEQDWKVLKDAADGNLRLQVFKREK